MPRFLFAAYAVAPALHAASLVEVYSGRHPAREQTSGWGMRQPLCLSSKPFSSLPNSMPIAETKTATPSQQQASRPNHETIDVQQPWAGTAFVKPSQERYAYLATPRYCFSQDPNLALVLQYASQDGINPLTSALETKIPFCLRLLPATLAEDWSLLMGKERET